VSTAAIEPRYRVCWPSEREATIDAERIKRQLSGTGADAAQLRAIDSALYRLATVDAPGRGKDLPFVVEWFLSNYAGDNSSKLLSAWIEEFKELKKAVVEAKSYREVEQYCDHCAAEFGHLTPRAITPIQMDTYMGANPSRWHRDKVLRNLFSWLSGEECRSLLVLQSAPLAASPFGAIPKPTYVRASEDVHALFIDRVRAAIELAIKEHPQALGQFVFGTLTGLRPDAEAPDFWALPNHGWRKIDFRRRLLTVTREIEKTGKRNRQLVLMPNVIEWLEYFKAHNTQMTCPRRAWRKFKTAAYPDMARVQDLLRHTAISNYAKRLSVTELEYQFATSQDMIVNHYLSQIADEAEVDAFFALTPASFGLV
jgi:hypothetical protein